MSLTPVIEVLRERIGLAPESLGATTLSRAVGDRMRALALTRPQAYADHLANDGQEILRLLDDIAVPGVDIPAIGSPPFREDRARGFHRRAIRTGL